MRLIEIISYLSILGLLIFAGYKDYKYRIISDGIVVLIWICGTIIFIGKGSFIDYFYYILFPSIPILILSFLIDSFSSKRVQLVDYFILISSIIIGSIVPFNFKLKYITFCIIFIASMVIQYIFSSRRKEKFEEREEFSIGGGDIKLIAVLGPVLKENMMWFLFVTFLLAFIVMKIKKDKNIYLAPFMCMAFLIYIGGIVGGIIG